MTTATTTLPGLVDEREACRIIGVAYNTLAVWRSRRSPNTPPYIRVGRAIRYRVSDLEQYLAERTISSSGIAAK